MSCKVLKYREQQENIIINTESFGLEAGNYASTFKKTHRGKTQETNCFTLVKEQSENNLFRLSTSYYIGVDWLEEKSFKKELIFENFIRFHW